MNKVENEELVIKCILLVGTLLMKSGSETYRVQDTMRDIALSKGFNNSRITVTSTKVIFLPGTNYESKTIKVTKRITDLEKISRINSVSLNLIKSKITIKEAYNALLYIDKTNISLPIFAQVVLPALASGGFIVLFQGKYIDIPAAILAGGLGYGTFLMLFKLTNIKFISDFIASVVIALVALGATKYGLGTDIEKIIVGSVMPLVPGITIANGVRDLVTGHFVVAMPRCAESCLTALAVGSGIASVVVF
ncbi:threonine/serine exporter family protein [Clostridium cylindrosporum]|uniref:Threonine/serine exporter-like N-terminal domain-containing protein n=1 Tax=Clostridium cylindrosporum DSM 605 TaxID=1121307 RepID=A0A0J8D7C7_CLOCY|nr:threonine/serine exporter family protein [Clostridium cylindrosporum]KMT21965.1 hypothetical protein CLCY_3c02360 [Clostridium cylindrosporum DSM 605]